MKYLICLVLFCASFTMDFSELKGDVTGFVQDVQSANDAKADRTGGNYGPIQRTFVQVSNGEPCRGTPGACFWIPDNPDS